ncbi:iron complex outermembrane receptor protein [Luteibacter rhizovicinus]|uniref:Iron complex outermembrane receptor protein n=1 Tax=Luteibacter rhizovicinus TaxID=242606 RepID=A0A4R3YX45_9GAMM|nr:TonB-dependent receptor [Luteibacter rhizovicinus]TCV97747.1 iron complex outermembrane receptor protein [Luteibacter rhizovicinus]
MNLRHKLLYVAMSLAFAPATLYAADQDATVQNPSSRNPEAADKKVQNLDAVSVTATKRDTPLQKTPVAVTAITVDTLDRERVMTVQDLTKLVPGLQGTSQGDHGVVTLTLRGIGNDSAKTEYADPEVATFVDGVYAPRAEAASGLLLDMDGVEVLRGPQGTLWGRNSTAGAISFQTAKPDIGAGFYGNAQIEAGNYNQIGSRAAFNLPISNTFAMRVAVVHEQHDGYVDYQNPSSQLPTVAQQQQAYLASSASGGTLANFKPIDPGQYVQRGDKYNAQDQSAARVSALWQPSDSFKWNLSYEYFVDRGTPSMSLMQTPRQGQDFWSALIDTAPYLHRTSNTVRSRMDWNINDSMQLSYIAGYNSYSGKSDFDQDVGVSVPTSFTTNGVYQDDRTNDSNYKNWSQEINLKSTGPQTVDWILGAYYGYENNDIRFDIPIMNGTRYGTVSWQGSFIQPKETVESYALFGQATWHLSDHWRLTGGLRWSHDDKENKGGINWGWAYDPTVPQVPISPDVYPDPSNGFAISQRNTAKYSKSKPTWLIRLDTDISENGMLYASVSTGYKSGGTQDAGTLYKPESLTNYEVGSKFAFFDGHMTWNTAIYYEDFKNFQLSAPIVYPDGNHGLGFSNVGGSTKVLGFESELAYQQKDDRFNLIFSAIPKKKLGTLIYAGSNDYQGLPACPPQSNLANCMNVTGNDLPHAPDVSLTGIYEHTFHLGNGGRLTPRASAQYQSSQWLSYFNLGSGDKQKAYVRGDLSLRYSEPGDKWWVNAYVQNVSDEKTRTSAGRFQMSDGSLQYVSQYLAPRTYGVQVGVWF